ncbi:MAG: EpsI family protein [Verrucomicrobiaceae bacterium]|nr:MAG: EpsI family protein [Verrucomicrobiaceae bacterium]
MITKRLAILLLVVLGGMSCAFVLPKKLGLQPVGIVPDLPEFMGEWWGRHMDVTQKERDTLGQDTEFARKIYSNGRGGQVLASIVLAGQDMMMAIHRPERCLAAQGWTFANPTRVTIDVPGKGRLEVTRVQNTKFVKGPDDTPVQIQNICYYWFAGSKDLTASHMERVWFDSRDRMMGGYVQRWAMIMISSDITAEREKFGRDEKATDQLLVDFVQKMAPQVHKPVLQYH